MEEQTCGCGKVRSCKVCQRSYNQRWYKENRKSQHTRVKANTARYQAENQEFLRKAKSEPCTDCGKRYHWFAMDYDHARGKKVKNLSLMARTFPLEKIKAEIEKCDLVCATCHRLRTAARLGLSPCSLVDQAPLS